MANRTLVNLLENSSKQFADHPYMWHKKHQSYEPMNYRETQKQVHALAAGLIKIGLEPGDRVVLMAEGRPEWVVSELAIIYAKGISVPLSVKIEELNELKFRTAHSGTRFAIVSHNQRKKLNEIKKDLPELEKLILIDPIDNPENDEVLWHDVFEQGQKHLATEPNFIAEYTKNINEDDVVNISYTSGTTADPKGIMLTHRNYTANVEQASRHFEIPADYVSLLILPLDHSFAHTVGIYILMYKGASMGFVQKGKSPVETLRNIPVNIKELKPTFLLSVPALAKNFKKNIEKAINQKGGLAKTLFYKGLSVGYRYVGNGYHKPTGRRALLGPLLKFYDKLVFSKIRQNFGNRLQFFVGGGAYLDPDLQRFYYAIGIPMYQGYGLSEAAPVISANSPTKHKIGSSGTVMAGIEIKIIDSDEKELPFGEKGEICVKGENVMKGYWNNPESTAKTLKNGWLHTGDMGYLDEDGFLFVLGRFKSLLISQDGEKYSPEGIEEALVDHSPYIEQVMLYNDHKPYTIALIVPNKEAVIKKTDELKLNLSDTKGQEAVIELFEKELEKYFTGGPYADMFPQRWLPKTFAILGEGFTEENRFLNSTLKMVRTKITNYYQTRIDFLFTAEGRNNKNKQNLRIIERLTDK